MCDVTRIDTFQCFIVIEISKDGLGDFQFGLVTGQLDGYLEQEEGTGKVCLHVGGTR